MSDRRKPMENLLEAIGMIQHCVGNMSDKEENVNVRISQTPGGLLGKRQTLYLIEPFIPKNRRKIDSRLFE
jgi:hypothetical protein